MKKRSEQTNEKATGGRTTMRAQIEQLEQEIAALKQQPPSDSSSRLLSQLTGLIDVANELSMLDSHDELCRQAVEKGRETLGFERIGLWLFDEDDPTILRGRYGTDSQGNTRDERSHAFQIDMSTDPWKYRPMHMTDTIMTRKVYLVDFDGKSVRESGEGGTALLWDGNENIGAIKTDNLISGRHFSDNDSKVFGLYASVLGYLISRNRDRQRIAQQNDILAIQHSVAQMTTGGLRPKQLAQNLLKIVSGIVPTDAFFLNRYDEDTGLISFFAAFDTIDGDLKEIRVSSESFQTTNEIVEVAKTKQPIMILREDPELESSRFGRAGNKNRPSASLLFVPMISGERVIGILSVQSYAPQAYTQTHVNILATIARQASPAMEVAMLGLEISTREEADREFREHLIQLVEISNILSLTDDIDEICRQAIQLGRERLRFDRLSIDFACEDDPAALQGTFGVDSDGAIVDVRDRRQEVNEDCGLKEILFDKKSSIVNERMVEEPNHSCWRFTQAAAAVWDGERIIGVIRADNFIEHRPFTKNQIELLRLYGLTLGMLCLRKETEEALRRSDRIYRSAIEQAAGVPYQLRIADWKYVFIGEGLKDLIEIAPEDFTVRKLDGLIQETIIVDAGPSTDLGEYSKEFKEGRRSLYQTDFRIITPSGQEKWLSDIAVPIVDEKTGEVTGSLGVLQDITLRKKVEEELRRNNERLTVLNKVAKLTLESASVPELCDRILEVVREVMPCDSFIVDLYDNVNKEVRAIRMYDTVDGEVKVFAPSGRNLKPRGPMFRAIEERKTSRIHREAPEKDGKGYIKFGSGKASASLIYTPLIAGDRVMGVLSAQSYDMFAYTERDEELLSAIARQAGPALDAVLLSTEIREREQKERQFSRQLATLVEVTNQMASAATVNELCKIAVSNARERLGFDRIGIWFLDLDEPGSAVGSYGVDEQGNLRDETENRIRVDRRSLMGQVLFGSIFLLKQEGVPLFNDCGTVIGEGVQATAAIWDGEKVIGCISVDNYLNKEDISENQCELLRLFSSALGTLVTGKRAEKELQDVHKIYREAIQTAQGVPYLLNYSKAKYDFMGSGCEQMLGVPAEELSLVMMDILVKESVPTRVPSEDSNEQVKAFIRGDIDRYKADVRVVTPQGEEKWLSDCSVPIRDPRTDKVVGSVGILQDITDRKRAEEALRESELKFRAVAETTRSAIFVSQGMKFTFVNSATEQITGYTREELEQMDFWEIVHPEFREIIRQRGLDRREGKPVPNRYECKILSKDGKERWLDEAVSVIELEGKKTVITAAFDITERKALSRLAQSLTAPLSFREIGRLVSQESRKLFQHDAFWFDIYDPVKRILPGTYAEDTPAEATEPEEVETSSQNVVDLNATIVFNNQSMLINRMEEPESELTRFGYTDRLSRSLMFVPIRWQGKCIGIISVQSYTPGKYNENDMELLQGFADQCGSAVHRVQTEERIRSASRLEATATLAGGVAHDFNNLMVAVMGNAELVKMDLEGNEEVMPMLDDIVAAAQKAGDLAQQMLAFARGGKYRPVVMNINDTIRETLSFQKRVFPPGIDIHYYLSPDLWNLNADPTQMSQVVMNLCLNAVEALGERGQIDIRTKNVEIDEYAPEVQTGVRPGKYVLLTVEDTGHGMTKEVLSKIFEPFYTTKFQGRGLGLAAVYGIVKNHEGYLNVRSQENQGTTFFIHLPITESEKASSGDETESLPTGTETILIADDEGAVIAATESMLTRLGYTVLLTRNGEEAIEKAKDYTGEIHLAILDMGMPVMSGADAYEHLVKIRPDMKILICSGYDYSYVIENFHRQDKPAAFLPKPFRTQSLAKKVRELLDSQV